MDLLVKSPGVPSEAPLVAAARRARGHGLERGRARARACSATRSSASPGTNGKTTTSRAARRRLRGRRPAGRRCGQRRPPAHRPGRSARRGGLGRLRALELPARGHRQLPPARGRPPQPHARPPRPPRRPRVRTGPPSCASSRTSSRTTSPSCRAASAPSRAARGGESSSPPATSSPPSRCIPGEHNRENAAAATAAARAAGIDDEAIAEALRSFPAFPTGSSSCARSAASASSTTPRRRTPRRPSAPSPPTRPGSASSSAEASRARRSAASPAPRTPSRRRARVPHRGGGRRARRGPGRRKASRFTHSGDLETAVRDAFADAEPGDVVLLSPACASYDQFSDFEAARASASASSSRRCETAGGRGHLEYHLLVLVTLGLVAFGLVMVYSASSARAAVAADDPAYYLKRQALYALVGLGLLAFLSRFDFRRLRHCVPLLLARELRAPPRRARARRAGQRSAPLALRRPRHGAAVGDREARARALGRRLPLAPPGPAVVRGAPAPAWARRRPRPAALILVEPDLGTAIAITIMVTAMLVVAGIRLSLLAGAALLIVATVLCSPSGSSPTAASGFPASSIPGRTLTAPASRPSRR